jgi:predicted transcriptional regulator
MIGTLIEQAGMTQAEVGALIGCTQSAVSNKISGRRPWAVEELVTLRAELSRRLGREISFDDLFPASTPTEEPAA